MNGEGTRNGRGFRVKSWADALAVSSIIIVLGSGVAWGLKLEANDRERETELNTALRELASLRAEVSAGILPRAEERINVNSRDIVQIKRDINRIEDRISD